MQCEKDNDIKIEKNEYFEMLACISLGHRTEQQDSLGYQIDNDSGIFIICDGMGGYQGGKRASTSAVMNILEIYKQKQSTFFDVNEMKQALVTANDKIWDFKKDQNELSMAGTTCVFVYINENKMNWCSVGDSRAYICRGDKNIQITQDHNYLTVLNGKLKEGYISQEEYLCEVPHGDNLINYLGMQDINLIDYNSSPFNLKSGDRVVLMSDGLYKYVNESEVFNLLSKENKPELIIQSLEEMAELGAKQKNIIRDNMSMIAILVK